MAKRVKRAGREYVVGYATTHNPVYGPDRDGETMYVDRMTFGAAMRYLPKMRCTNADRVVYRLVPEYVLKGKKK